MARTSLARRIADNSAADRAYSDNEKEALRLQAKAWRQLTLIACRDPDYAREKARWLFFVTVPWVQKDAVEKFIAEHQDRATECGKDAGIFDR